MLGWGRCEDTRVLGRTNVSSVVARCPARLRVAPNPLTQSSWGPRLGAADWGASRGSSSGVQGGRGSCEVEGGIGRDLSSCRRRAQSARRERTRLPVAHDRTHVPFLGSSTSPSQPRVLPNHTPYSDLCEPVESAPGPKLVTCRVTWSSVGTSADSLLGKFGTVRHGQERLAEYPRGGGTGAARQGCVSPWVPTGVRGRVVGASV